MTTQEAERIKELPTGVREIRSAAKLYPNGQAFVQVLTLDDHDLLVGITLRPVLSTETCRHNLGRPIDMGGPRNQWIERSPWDDV